MNSETIIDWLLARGLSVSFREHDSGVFQGVWATATRIPGLMSYGAMGFDTRGALLEVWGAVETAEVLRPRWACESLRLDDPCLIGADS